MATVPLSSLMTLFRLARPRGVGVSVHKGERPLSATTPMYDELRDMLYSLDGIAQNQQYHPEGDALYHSLQVFEHARRSTRDRVLLGAALLHDVGKALDGPTHDIEGADALDGLVSERLVWLVRHHLDLLKAPGQTRRRLRGTTLLRDLELLRAWDLAGRSPTAHVGSVDDALRFVLIDPSALAPQGVSINAHDHQEDLLD